MNIRHYPHHKLRLFVSAMLLSCSTVAAQASELQLRFAWYMPPHTATAEQAELIAKNIKTLSHGQIDVQTYPSGSLFKASNIAKGIMNNTTNMGINALHWWSKYEPAFEFDTIPFLVPDAKSLLANLHGKLGQDINTILEKHGVRIIAWGFYGYAKSYINNHHAIIKPSDLKGLRIRSEGKLSALFLQSQGATPVAIDSSEVYTAIQRGALDGGVSGLSTIVSRKWYEVGKYVSAIHYVPLIYPVQVNLHWWNGLTPQQRSIISKAAQSSEKSAIQSIEHEYTQDIQTLKQAGNHVSVLKGAALKPWMATAGTLDRKNYLKETGATGKMLLQDINPSSIHG
ncbi:TRAP transporter substrate-binding protein [Celerinatantimonas yamalensis]|uniref:TRAP transporter substrate-binding protein DctP n=1 Tax=Celerinatantimonas yamalensis TaxID=559956 RepID=A0ABW9G7A9_9GAMM